MTSYQILGGTEEPTEKEMKQASVWPRPLAEMASPFWSEPILGTWLKPWHLAVGGAIGAGILLLGALFPKEWEKVEGVPIAEGDIRENVYLRRIPERLRGRR